MSPQSLLIGEVWEDASNKISYGQRRRYLLGGQLDSVMNYPFREAILRYLKEGDSAFFSETVESVCENYPPQALHLLMNPLSTHDTPRAITLLAGEDPKGKDRLWQSRQRLSSEQWELGKKRLLLAMVIQYTLPGFPSVYYGDEQLMQGYGDPFNRCFFTRKDQDPGFLAAVQWLGRMRKSQSCYRSGNFRVLRCDENCLAFARTAPGSSAATVINRTPGELLLSLPGEYDEVIFSRGLTVENGRVRLMPYGCGVLLCPLPDSDESGDHQGLQQPGV